MFTKAQNSSWSSYDWEAEARRLRDCKPHSKKRRIGPNPIPEASRAYDDLMRSWNATYRHANTQAKKKRAEEQRDGTGAAVLARRLAGGDT